MLYARAMRRMLCRLGNVVLKFDMGTERTELGFESYDGR